MGKPSKAAIAHLNNLNNLSKASLKSHRATVKKMPDSDDDDYSPEDTKAKECMEDIHNRFFTLEVDCDSDSDSDLTDLEERDLDEDEEEEIRDDVALLTFSSAFRRAQKIAVEAENKKWGERKRLKRYTGNSACSMWHHTQKHRKLTTESQKSIKDWFPIKEKSQSLVSQDSPILIDKNSSTSPETVSSRVI